MSSFPIPIIGVIGGIGSGKTALTLALAERLRVCRLDADGAGHAALELPEVRESLSEIFGTGIFDEQGQIIRQQIADQVFGESPKHHRKRNRLNALVHPVIRHLLEDQIRQIDWDQFDVVLLDAPLVLEAGWDTICDAVVFVDAPEDLRRQRVLSRGWDAGEFQRRERSQLPVVEKRRRADFVIDNSGSLSTAAQSLAAWIGARFTLPQQMAAASLR